MTTRTVPSTSPLMRLEREGEFLFAAEDSRQNSV